MGGARIGGGIGWLLLRKFLHLFSITEVLVEPLSLFFIFHFSFCLFRLLFSSFFFLSILFLHVAYSNLHWATD